MKIFLFKLKMNKFYETFFPSMEKIKQLNDLSKEIEKEAIKNKKCIVCKYYNYNPYIPGFITYEGDCELDKTPSFQKSCELWTCK